MEIDQYSPAKTAQKAALPVSILIMVNIILLILKQAEIEMDESIVWQIALAGYGGILTLKNYIKNHKRGKAASG